jgi:hypothetical protein
MATRRPLVLNDGLVSELLDGDTVRAGTSTTEVVAGSGLTGGGSVSSNPELDAALAPNPSGIIYVGDALGIDGAAGVTADIALASGSAAAVLASDALASGNNSLVVASAALASGNAALGLVPTLTGGGGPLQTTLVAGSAIASGYAVGVDDAGKVQSVSSYLVTGASFPSPSVVFESADTQFTRSVYAPNANAHVFAYNDSGNSQYGTAIVGSVSGTSISFGTPVVFASIIVGEIDITYNSSRGRVVIAYTNTAAFPSTGNAISGLVSGTSISFAAAATYRSAYCGFTSITSVSSSYVVIAYQDNGNSSYGYSVVASISSGGVLSYGTPVAFRSAAVQYTAISYDSGFTGQVVISFTDFGNSQYGTSIVGTTSATSISFGSPTVFVSSATTQICSIYSEPSDKIIIAYNPGSRGDAVVGTILGTSISFGSPVNYSGPFTTVSYQNITLDTNNNLIFIGYRSASGGKCVDGSISGTSLSFTSPATFALSNTWDVDVSYDPGSQGVVVSYRNSDNSNYGTAIVSSSLISTGFSPTLNSYPNVLGIAQSTVASGSPCLVNLPGTLYNEPAANLTTGAFYYANPTTSGITTTSTQPTSWNGQVPWNYIGRAVTSSGLMLLKSI